MNKKFNWKIFFTIWIATVIGVIAVLPYTLALQAGALAKATLPIPLPLLITIQVAQNAVMFGIATWIGLFLANRTGLGAPILEEIFARENVTDRIKRFVVPAIVLGVVGSLLIIALDVWVFAPAIKSELGVVANAPSVVAPAAWQGFLASFYGGIDEEVLLRLFLMTLLAWLGKFVSHTAEGKPTMIVFWIANILAAILFGLGHLPATATLMPLTPLVIVRAVALNGIVGLACGYLYSKHGIESAMLSHFSADIVLHVLFAI